MTTLEGLTGIVASLHTPFTDDDRPDHESLVRLIDHVAAAGCSGVLATAVAGEVGSLTPDERHALLDTVTDACRGRLQVVAGVSAPDLATSLDLAHRARTAGADLVLWQPPTGMADAGLGPALRALGDAGPGPVMLQDLDWHGPGIPIAMVANNICIQRCGYLHTGNNFCFGLIRCQDFNHREQVGVRACPAQD